MHVAVIHRITDPAGFEEAERAALAAGLPEGRLAEAYQVIMTI